MYFVKPREFLFLQCDMEHLFEVVNEKIWTYFG